MPVDGAAVGATYRNPEVQASCTLCLMSTDDADRAAPQLAAAYAELQSLLLSSADLRLLLEQIAQLATTVVPAHSCGITMLRGADVATVATSDELAGLVDEIRYAAEEGPCLEALRTATTIRVDDLATDDRWNGYRAHALAHGVRSSLSCPLVVEGRSLGALNLYGLRTGDFGPAELRRAAAFAEQAATTIAIGLREYDRAVLETQLREALTVRSVIDQALGILIGQQRISSQEAFAVLRQASQDRNRPLRSIAAELVETMSGQPPQPSRPFAAPR